MGLWDDEVVGSCGCMILKYKVPRSQWLLSF